MREPLAFCRNIDSSHCYSRLIQCTQQNSFPKGTKSGVSEGHFSSKRTKASFFVGFVPRSRGCPWHFLPEEPHVREGLDLLWSPLSLSFTVKPPSGRETMSRNISKCVNMPSLLEELVMCTKQYDFPKISTTHF